MRIIQGDMIGSGLRFAIIGSRFNELITSKADHRGPATRSRATG